MVLTNHKTSYRLITYRLLVRRGANHYLNYSKNWSKKMGSPYRFHYHNFSGSITYNFHGHEAERVELSPDCRWFDNEYGILGRGSDISANIAVGDNTFTYGGALQQEGNTASIAGAESNNAAQYYITTQACAGQSDITHKIAGTVEWHYKKLRFPVTFSVGSEYEFPHLTHSNGGIHSWALWSKLSVCF